MSTISLYSANILSVAFIGILPIIILFVGEVPSADLFPEGIFIPTPLLSWISSRKVELLCWSLHIFQLIVLEEIQNLAIAVHIGVNIIIDDSVAALKANLMQIIHVHWLANTCMVIGILALFCSKKPLWTLVTVMALVRGLSILTIGFLMDHVAYARPSILTMQILMSIFVLPLTFLFAIVLIDTTRRNAACCRRCNSNAQHVELENPVYDTDALTATEHPAGGSSAFSLTNTDEEQ